VALAVRSIPSPDDDDAIARFAVGAPGWRIEFDVDGTMLVSPIFTDGGPREVEAAYQLRAFASIAGGKVYSSSTGFRLPDGSLRSPDAAWISSEHIALLEPERKKKYWRTCPDVVIEILSESDDWHELVAKTERYLQNGATFAVAIDPATREVATFGEPPAGLQLDYEAIASA
jgi:Uma2 family endonuclease